MSAEFAPEDCRVGLAGYGEVGQILAEDLRARGVARVAAFDIKLDTDTGASLREHAQRCGVVLTASHAELASGADLVLSAVTASQTVAVAEAIAPAIDRARGFSTSIPLRRVRRNARPRSSTAMAGALSKPR